MKRQIKFRGLGYHDRLWHYGSLITTDDNDMTILNHEDEYDVIPDTVGQYTGLNDCNGKEIYEGDLVRMVANWLPDTPTISFLVEWFVDRFILRPEDKYQHMGIVLLESIHHALRIIGNMCDDPKLVEYNYGR